MTLKVIETFDLRCPCLSCGRKNESKHFGPCRECQDARIYADLLHEEDIITVGVEENSNISNVLHCDCSYEQLAN